MSLDPMNDDRVGWQLKAAGHVSLVQALKRNGKASMSLSVMFVESVRIIEIRLLLKSGNGGVNSKRFLSVVVLSPINIQGNIRSGTDL